MDDLLQDFIGETRETLEAVSGEIVGWEADPTDRARLDAIFRFVHTIKGSCGFLDLPRLLRLSHAAEDALASVRSGTRQPDRALVNAILAIIDRISELVDAIDSGEALDDSGEDMLLAALDSAIAVAPAHADPVRRQDPATVKTGKRSVRLSVDLLDRMMSGVSDMVLARNQLARRTRDIDDPGLSASLERLSMTVAELRDTVTRTRMQRIEALFSPLPRIVRDTAATLGKSVSLVVEGSDVELDREMVELLRDPLVHIVRNAIDHGIEAPERRLAKGKPANGRLHVVARQAGNVIIVEIGDDGDGVDTPRLVARAMHDDPARAPALQMLNEPGRLALIFEPGLTSRDEVTAVSGRGVGMDVVKANVEQIGGRISLQNRPGQGLIVVLEVPLTLAILTAVIVETAGTRFAIPRQAVEEIVSTSQAGVRVERLGGAAMAVVRGRRLPLVDLSVLLRGAPAREASSLLAILSLRDITFAMPLDGVADSQELVVKPAAPAVMQAGVYAGQMLPDDGVPILLLDCAGIATRAGLSAVTRATPQEETPVAPPALPALLFIGLDGVRRMIVADAVDRIEAVAPGDVRIAAGAAWLSSGGRTIRLWSTAPIAPESVGAVLRLSADAREIAYPVREALEIIPLPEGIVPVDAGVIAGVVTIDGEPVELVDPLRLFDDLPAGAGRRPLCLLHGRESAWMEAFLRPTIEAAGYDVVRTLQPGAAAAVTLALDDDAEPAPDDAIRLSRAPGAALYRYDRAAIVAALAERRA